MVKTKKTATAVNVINQGIAHMPSKASKIGPSTAYDTIGERLSPFGGLLGLIKFFDLVGFKEVFDHCYKPPCRQPQQGHYRMMCAVLMLLFIGFNRIWHFLYLQMDSMLCSFLGVEKLPYVTTFWRYINSLGINQDHSLLMVNSALRERVWHLCGKEYKKIHIDIDTTVETVFGDQQGVRKGHNTKYRGKLGFRPVLCFIEETREYLTGRLRKGETLSGEEFGKLIRSFSKHLPGCVEEVVLRADGEFISWEAVLAASEMGYDFIFANKVCRPPFKPKGWYKVHEKDQIEYNSCMYQPEGWEAEQYFVAMRIPLENTRSGKGGVQHELFEDNKYKYRIFVTSLKRKAHKVIKEYDKRADCENLVGESKREGLSAIPSRKFANNAAYFQIVMLAYNIWRWLKLLAGQGWAENEKGAASSDAIVSNTIRIARLKLLMIAAKITDHANVTEVKYSEHDSRVSGLFGFYKHLDKLRSKARPWLDPRRWKCLHLATPGWELALNST